MKINIYDDSKWLFNATTKETIDKKTKDLYKLLELADLMIWKNILTANIITKIFLSLWEILCIMIYMQNNIGENGFIIYLEHIRINNKNLKEVKDYEKKNQ